MRNLLLAMFGILVFTEHAQSSRPSTSHRRICTTRATTINEYTSLSNHLVRPETNPKSLFIKALRKGSQVRVLHHDIESQQAQVEVLSTEPLYENRYGDDAVNGDIGWIFFDVLNCQHEHRHHDFGR